MRRARSRRTRSRPRASHSDPIGHPNELGDRSRLHLVHDSGSVDLDRLLGHAQFEGDLLVQHSSHDPREDLALARGQLRDALLELAELCVIAPVVRVLGQGALDRPEQVLLVDRLDQQIDRPRPSWR